jgi:hypothetical protein
MFQATATSSLLDVLANWTSMSLLCEWDGILGRHMIVGSLVCSASLVKRLRYYANIGLQEGMNQQIGAALIL